MSKIETTPQLNEICRISKGTKITGICTSSSDIRIDGCFEGDIYTKGKLVAGETAEIKGRIACQSADFWGKVEGEVFISDSITFKSKSNFTGVLKTAKLCIEMGAVYNGSCNIITTDEFNKLVKGIIPNTNEASTPSANPQNRK